KMLRRTSMGKFYIQVQIKSSKTKLFGKCSKQTIRQTTLETDLKGNYVSIVHRGMDPKATVFLLIHRIQTRRQLWILVLFVTSQRSKSYSRVFWHGWIPSVEPFDTFLGLFTGKETIIWFPGIFIWPIAFPFR